MCTSMHCGAAVVLAIGTLGLQPSAQATAHVFDEMQPVSLQALDHARGGFAMGFDLGRMMMSMRMTQFSMVNGVPVPDQATHAGPTGGLSTVIQNSQHGQMISAIRTIDITITSQALARTVNLQSLTQHALLKFLH